MPDGVKLTLVPVTEVPEKVIPVGAVGLVHGLDPVPVAVIGSRQLVAVPLKVSVDVSAPTPTGIYSTYNVADKVVVVVKLALVPHVLPSDDTWKSGFDEVTVTVPGVRPVPLTE